ncbi:uncharacterized protein RHO25_012452 [Cercospora beticola]|nr:hypothetical protein RHO25_012452 [Cercospora beticola]
MEWPIAQVLRKKVDGDRTLYLVRWKPTMLNRNEVHLGDNGISYAFSNGREWEIEDVTRCSGGVYEVTWTDTWQEYSDLAGTEDDLIADFEAGVLPPEEAAEYASMEMPFDIFVPDPNADYTDSFVAKLTDELRNGEATRRKWQKVPIWVACLDLPTRNRLVFRKGYSDRRNVVNMLPDTARLEHRRILSIHRTGNAMARGCEDCREGKGALRRCVVDRHGSALNGSCTNCSIGGRMATCSFSGRVRKVSHEAARTSNAIVKIKKESRDQFGKALYKPAAPSAKRALEFEDTSSAVKKRVARPIAFTTFTPPATDHNDRLASEQLLDDIKRETSVFTGVWDDMAAIKRETSVFTGAWDDMYVSNHIGGPADWSSPNVKDEEGQVRGDDDDDDDLKVMDADAVEPGEQNHVQEMEIRQPSSKRAPKPSMDEAEERKAPSVSLPKADAKPRSAEEVRRNLLARFQNPVSSSNALPPSGSRRSQRRREAKRARKAATTASLLEVSSKPASQSSDTSTNAVTMTDLDVEAAQDLLDRCLPQQWNMLMMAWELWMQECKEEGKVQPFTSGYHFFAAVWMDELRAGAV